MLLVNRTASIDNENFMMRPSTTTNVVIDKKKQIRNKAQTMERTDSYTPDIIGERPLTHQTTTNN
jgi:hypothetical protein